MCRVMRVEKADTSREQGTEVLLSSPEDVGKVEVEDGFVNKWQAEITT